MNIKHALTFATKLSSDSARLDVEILLAKVLAKPRTFLFTWPDKRLTANQESQFLQFFERRAAGEPIAYIIGSKDFWTLELEVAPSTLIPRPDTEVLVEVALEFLLRDKPQRVLDLGTGTGAIALAIAKERPYSEVVAIDFSNAAVDLAQRNAAKNRIRNVQIFQSDWFENVTGVFDIIVSNPPYIDAQDPHLHEGDVRFEPSTALVAAEEGIADIRNIAQYAPAYLVPGGRLLLEHGWNQAQSVQDILRHWQFSSVQSWQDYGGAQRVTGGSYLSLA